MSKSQSKTSKNISKKHKSISQHEMSTAAREVAVLPLQSFFVMALGVSLLLITLPRGAFFPTDKLMFSVVYLLLGVIVFLLISLFHRRLQWDSLHGWSPLLLMVAYWVPVITFQWVVLWDALTMILYYLVALVVFLLVRNLNQESKYTAIILNFALASGLVVAVTSLLGAAGIWEYQDLIMGNRLAGTFQYPNTLAAWMMSLYFIAAGCMLVSTDTWKKVVYGSVGFFFLFIFVFTYSRAAWLLFPLVSLAYLVVLPGKHRIQMLLNYIMSGIPLVLFLQPFYRVTTGDDTGGTRVIAIALSATILFALLFVVLLKVQEKLDHWLSSKGTTGRMVLYGITGVVLAGAAMFMVMALNTTEPLVFDNRGLDEPRNQTLTRSVPDVLPQTEYELVLQLETSGGNEEQWPWLVLVTSGNDAKERTGILQHIGEVDASGHIVIPFETLEDTTSLHLVFRNHFPDTAVTFSAASLHHPEADASYQIPLRYTYIPEALVQRFESIDIEERSADTRVAYYRDSMTILKNHPLGAGGGAWDALYRQYQSQPYFSRQVHNFFLQTGVESGVMGLAVLAGMVGLILWGLLEVFRKKDALQVSLHVGALSLLAHSFLDFNFSYLSTFILFWMLLGLLKSPHDFMTKSSSIPGWVKNGSVPGWLVALALVPVVILNMVSWGGARSYETAAMLFQMEETQAGYDSLDQAAAMDRIRPDYRVDLTRSLMQFYGASNDISLLQVAEHHWHQGIRYAPRHRALLMTGAALRLEQDDDTGARELLQQRIQQAPLDQVGYDEVSTAYLNVVRHQITSEKKNTVTETAQEGLELLSLLHQANERAVVPLSVTNTFKANLMQLSAWKESAEGSLPFSLNPQEDPVYVSFLDLEHATGAERAWRAWGSENAELVTTLTEKGLVTINTGTGVGFPYTPNIQLQPDTTYQVWVDFEEISLESPLRIHVIATDSEEHRVQVTHVHDSQEAGDQTHFTFTTSDDIDPAKDQYIRFDHPGRNPEADPGTDPGSFTIRGIIVQVVQ